MKKLLIVVLALFLMAGCGANVTKEDYEQKITDLETKLEALTEQIEALNETVKELTDKLRDGDSYHVLEVKTANGASSVFVEMIQGTIGFDGELPDRLEFLENLTRDEFGIYYHHGGSFEEVIVFKALGKADLDLTGEYAGATILADLSADQVLIALVNLESKLDDEAKTYLTNQDVAIRFAAERFTLNQTSLTK